MKELEPFCLSIREDLLKVEALMQRELQSNVPFVRHVSEYIITNGGKRLRPILVLLSAKIAGYSGDSAIHCAAALEFMHTASLLHDDVVDNADLRRGKSSANAIWGNHVSVLVGDFFYCRACDILVGQKNLSILKKVTDTMVETTEGEVLEIAKSNSMDITEEDYLQIITRKTAILISACCQIGAILGNISEEFALGLGQYGLYLGISFQLADDLLDYMSESEKIGKLKGTDLREGKLTLPLIIALKKATPEESRIIKDALIAKELEERRLKEILSIIQKYDGITYTLNLAKQYVLRAKGELVQFKPSIEKEALTALANFAIERNR
ncbi:MAG: polyprenyl synthetase family protein [Deltaproteobacteria bacterium]|nr:polyprenyl synthetase family protein [Deltaproteobacteria bacterium]